MKVTCDTCGHTETIQVDYSNMQSLQNASKKINKLFRIKGDYKLCRKNCEDIRFSNLNNKFHE